MGNLRIILTLIGMTALMGMVFNSCDNVQFAQTESGLLTKIDNNNESFGDLNDGDLIDPDDPKSNDNQNGNDRNNEEDNESTDEIVDIEDNEQIIDDMSDQYPCTQQTGEVGVLICHLPSGNISEMHTICIGRPAVQAHVGIHGDGEERDFFGPCLSE